MSLLGRLRDWLAGLFGREGETAVESVCAVCGTTVADPDEGCPLCGSHDLEPRGEADRGAGAASDATAGNAPPDAAGDAEPERRSVPGTTDDAAARLRDLGDGAGEEAGGSGADATADDGDDTAGERSSGTGDGGG